MASSPRLAGTAYQGEDERVAYGIDFDRWGTPIAPVVTLREVTTGIQRPEKLLGVAAIAGNIVTTPKVIDLEPRMIYRLDCKLIINGNDLEAYLLIIGEE